MNIGEAERRKRRHVTEYGGSEDLSRALRRDSFLNRAHAIFFLRHTHIYRTRQSYANYTLITFIETSPDPLQVLRYRYTMYMYYNNYCIAS